MKLIIQPTYKWLPKKHPQKLSN
ncbi:hypothetical protein BLA29_015382 [Euroglyphus maynei]|uniref:Uncharacterized protein n=1 Tax=Euroglyphus maynei TaxID=6958 RepID=A0A1Y3ANI3_EURMA|nr:hypothetical protein BLA29_015382 [Euroglyphus maynei]